MHAVRRDLFPPTKYVWATEVSVPGGDSVRRMDACAIDARVAPHLLTGIEVKVSRGDWLNDKGGLKSKPARDATDQFWFVFGSPDIYKISEVPKEAGIITIADGRATVVREPAHPGPCAPYDRDLMATILTRSLREDKSAFVRQVERTSEAKGYQKGLSAAKRSSVTTKATPALLRTKERVKYDPGRYNLDDGEPLDLP
jgi:hypothetical protein